MSSKPVTCPLKFGAYVNNTFLRNESTPISRRSISFKDDGTISIKENFSDGVIKKAWNLDNDITRKYVYIDKDTLEKRHLLIKKTYNDPKYPFAQLQSINEIPDSKWKNDPVKSLSIADGKIVEQKFSGLQPDVLARENGGWVIDEGLRKSSRDPCKGSTGDPKKDEACMIITSLLNMQNGEGYNFSTTTKLVMNDGHGNLVAMMNIDPITERLSSIGVGSSSFQTYLNFIVSSMTYWMQTSDFNLLEKGMRKMVAESKKAAAGKESMIKDKDDLKRWASNYFGSGKPDAGYLEMPFFANPIAINDSDRSFLKDDFLDTEKYSFKDCGVSDSIGLFDADGNYVKHGRKHVKNVVGNTSSSELKKWSWGCISSSKIPPRGFVPARGGELKRSLFKNRKSDDTFETTVKSVREAIDDGIIGLWNAMVESEIAHSSNVTQSTIDEIPAKIMEKLDKTTRKEDVMLVKEVFDSMPREPLVVNGKTVKASPYLIPRKDRSTKGMTRSLSSLSKKGRIVGIETSLSQIQENCEK